MEKKILVVGDVMLDRYIVGHVERISPEAPVPIVNVTSERNTLGGAANVASNLANLGASVVLFGGISADANGSVVENLLMEKGIERALVKEDFPCTITKTRVVANHQQITRVDREQPLSNTAALEKELDLLPWSSFQLVVISDYLKGVCSSRICRYIFEKSKEMNLPVIVDPKGREWEKYQGAFMVTPNLKELGDMLIEKLPNTDEVIGKKGEEVRKLFGIEHMLVTRSEKGMTLINATDCTHYPTEAQDVYDVSGAGDTVVAVLGYALCKGHSLAQSIVMANKAAGYVVSKFGTYAISKEELEALY